MNLSRMPRFSCQDLIRQVPHHRIQKWLLVQIFYDNISPDDHRRLDQFTHFRFSSLSKEEGWNHIEEYVEYQDDSWDDPPLPINISFILEIIKPTLEGHLRNLPKYVCLSGGDIYDDPSLLRFYRNDDIPPHGNIRRKEKGEEDHEKGLGEMLNQHRNGMHEQFSQILATIGKSQTPAPKNDASTFAFTTRSGTTTRDPPYPTPLSPTTIDNTERKIEEEGTKGEETTTTHDK
ncbi:hypothetical protein Tco_1212737 [Tanacetum coccineum]